MRRGGVSVWLLASGLLLTVSLYLPWFPSYASCNGFCLDTDGWISGVGPAAAISALLLAVLAAADLRRADPLPWSPLGRCAVCAAYFGIAVFVGVLDGSVIQGLSSRGAYLRSLRSPWADSGLLVAAVALFLLVVAAWRAWDGSLPRREGLAVRSAGVVLVAALLGSFLLPWVRIRNYQPFTSAGIQTPPLVVASVLAVWLAAAWWRARPWPELLGLSAATLLFTAGGLAFAPREVRAWGSWTGVGIALALFALAAARSPRPALPPPPPWRVVLGSAAAVLLAASLFLPWQQSCDSRPGGLGCLTSDGWSTTGTAAAVLGLALAVALLLPDLLRIAPALLAAGVALFVATAGFELETGPGYSFGYGAWIGFACAAALVAVGVARVSPRLPRRREWIYEAVAAVAACVAYLAVLLLPWWGVLPRDAERELRFGGFTSLTVTGVVLALRLLGDWVSTSESEELVLLPLAMLVLAILDIVQYHYLQGLTWGGAIVVMLCLGLALLGRIRLHGVPEVFRIDRIQTPDP